MKKKYLLYFFSALLIAGFNSCQEKESDTPEPEPVPTPTAAFTQNRNFIEMGETVSFTNTSSGATRYEWDFGNGETSTNQNPTIKFTYPGNFKIRLISYNQKDEADTATALVKVGQFRALTKIEILKLNFQNPSGAPWDPDGSGPDVVIFFKPGQYTTLLAGIFENLTPASLPITWTPSGSGSTPVENMNWYIRLEDMDHGAIMDDERMYDWNINPYQVSVKSYTDSKGYFTLEDAQKQIKIVFHFEVR